MRDKYDPIIRGTDAFLEAFIPTVEMTEPLTPTTNTVRPDDRHSHRSGGRRRHRGRRPPGKIFDTVSAVEANLTASLENLADTVEA